MELSAYFKSVLEQEPAAVVLCDLAHRILYMNPAAQGRYEKWGGAALVGQSLLDCHNAESGEKIREVVAWFAQSATHNSVFTFRNEKEHKDVYMVALRDEAGRLIGYYEKHVYRTPETGKPYDFQP